MNKNYVEYSDFGAKGDGVTNDFFAIKAAHEYANAHGLPVKAGEGKTFLITETEINGIAEAAVIKTNTDFCGSTVIVDDTDISCIGESVTAASRGKVPIFNIASNFQPEKIAGKYIARINAEGGILRDGAKKLSLGIDYPAMLIISSADERVYIRYGGNEDAGVTKEELVIVDGDGNIDASTPLLFDYKKVTDITAYRIDEPTLTVENLRFVTRASRVNIVDKYAEIRRAIMITRPNTHLKNLKREVVNEIFKGEEQNGIPFIGHSYYGGINIANTHNILLENVEFQARAYYLQGTYDLIAEMVNALTLKGCRQNNFFANDDERYPLKPAFGKWWGVAGTNYCKNLIYDSCKLTRYDAHRGVVNGAIKNCEVSSIRLIGGGDMLIENTKIYANCYSTLQLREDFGATFRGTLTVKDCEFIDVLGTHTSFMVAQSANWWYGYPTYFPNVIIDNLKVSSKIKELPILWEFPMETNKYGYFYRSVRDVGILERGAMCADGGKNVNPYAPPSFIKVLNNENNGYDVTVPSVPFFKNTELLGVKIVD